MSRCQLVARPLARQLRQPASATAPSLARAFSSSTSKTAEVQQQKDTPQPSELDLNPDTVLPEFESNLIKSGKMPIGSRRRRVAMRSVPESIPFEQLPYQAFQEARKILAADREDKLQRISTELNKISNLEGKNPEEVKGGQYMKDTKLASLRRHVEQLKIQADVNDPVVKKRFEDGLGDMNKPIYRYYAEKRWRGYEHRLITQRIEQHNIVPDLLPKFAPTADVQLYFRQHKIPAGQTVDSLTSEQPPRLRVQVFDKGERLVSIVVMDADVPNTESDAFSKRCHFLAANIPLSPTETSLPLSRIKADDQLAVPWLPAFAQKGTPAHRLAIFVLEQQPGQRLDIAKLRELYQSTRDTTTANETPFSLKSYKDKFALKPFGFSMFRSLWDDNTASVMARHSIPGAEIEFRHARVHSLKPPKKQRGWEAKHQGPKYRHLDKYTKRIRGLSNGRGWTRSKK